MCKLCDERIKNWNGVDPKCGFDVNGNFVEDNWNCATLSELRQIGWDISDGMSITINHHTEDEKLFTFNTEMGFIILGVYKDRGRTGKAIYMDSDTVRPLKLSDVEEYFEWLKSKGVI